MVSQIYRQKDEKFANLNKQKWHYPEIKTTKFSLFTDADPITEVQKPETLSENLYNLLALVHFGMSSLSNSWPNKQLLRINQPFGIQSELIT